MSTANKESRQTETREYEVPKVLASYTREELAESLRPHGPSGSYYNNGGGCGACGCGGGSILTP